jgi:hypothetical protein
MRKGHISILYVDCKKFPTNRFVGNLCPYNSVIFFVLHKVIKKLLNKHNTLKKSSYPVQKTTIGNSLSPSFS